MLIKKIWCRKEVAISCQARALSPAGHGLGLKALVSTSGNGSEAIAGFAPGLQCFRKGEALELGIASSKSMPQPRSLTLLGLQVVGVRIEQHKRAGKVLGKGDLPWLWADLDRG